MWKNPATFLSLLSLWFSQYGVVEAVLQTAALDVTLTNGSVFTMLASQASFGSYPRMNPANNQAQTLTLPPSSNALLCYNATSSAAKEAYTGLMLVPRGNCTFEQKALNAQRLGATGIVVYGTLASRYSLNTTKYINHTDHVYTTDDIVYPQKFYDYDCEKGRAEIPSSKISMTPLPYNAATNDPVLAGPSSLCYKNSPDSLQNCPSQACLLTGQNVSGKLEACCAWDLAIWLYNDPDMTDDNVHIPAIYLTMEQANVLKKEMKYGSVQAILYARYRPAYNPSALLIWGLGVFVAALAAYMSASEYLSACKRVEAHQDMAAVDSSVEMEAGHGRSETQQLSYQRTLPPEESLELNVEHAFGFIIMASSALLILFFFKIYNVVKVMYALGCSKAVSQVIFFPMVARLARRMRIRDKIVWRTGTEDFGDITRFDVISSAFGFGLGLAWLIVAFTVRHPENITFFWITQDIMGACMCIMFLSIIKLNSIRVASILLIIAFFYDIFMVFITPLIFNGESVMIIVATSGGPPKADPSWCEKYPDDVNCQGGDPLPMLLTVPRIGDYQGGASLLGLGDIVLPGLLLSFAARLDAAKGLLGVISGGSGAMASYTCREDRCGGALGICNGGYFAPLIVAYALGLFMANAAVYLMNMGQPALLYLVPCCLGTICYMGWRRNELNELWNGPKVIRTADTLLYGESHGDVRDSGLSRVPTEEGLEAPVAPSAQEEGDVPLLT